MGSFLRRVVPASAPVWPARSVEEADLLRAQARQAAISACGQSEGIWYHCFFATACIHRQVTVFWGEPCDRQAICDTWLTAMQAAEVLGVSLGYFYHLASKWSLPKKRAQHGWVWAQYEVDQLARKRREQGFKHKRTAKEALAG